MKKIQFLLLFQFLIYFANSQELGYKIFTTDDGLISNQVWYIRQDPKGFLWLATPEGISRFDGRNFKNYSKKDGLTGSQVWDFGFFGDTVFILLNSTIDIIVNSKIINYGISDSLKLTDDNNFSFIKGSIYISVESKNTGRFYFYNVNSRKVDPKFDNVLDGIINAQNFVNIDNKLFISYNEGNKFNILHEVILGNNGSYYLVKPSPSTISYNYLLSKISDNKPIKIIQNKKRAILDRNMNFFFKNQKLFNLRIGNNEHLVIKDEFIYHYAMGKITAINENFYNTFCITQAIDSSIWVATDKGLVRIFHNGIYNFLPKNGYPENAWCIFPQDSNNLWFGVYNKGVLGYNNGKLKTKIDEYEGQGINPYPPISRGFYDDMVVPTGNKGLMVYNFRKNNYKFVKCNPTEDTYFSWKDTISNRILTGRNCLFYLDTNYILQKIVRINENTRLFRINGATRRGDYYYFSSGNNIHELHIKTLKQRKLGFNNIRFNSISCDYKGNLWAASDVGIYLMTAKDTLSWLNDEHIWALRIDKNNRLYAVSKNALYFIDINKLYKTGKVEIHIITEDQGFYGAGEQDAFFIDDDGKVWLPGAKNSISIYPDRLDLYIPRLKSYISKAECISNNIITPFETNNIIHFKHTQKDFNFEFETVCLKHPEKVLFQYRLKGYEEEWSEPVKPNNIRYTNIPPGNYEFQVRAAIYGQFDDSIIATIPFYINSPFWKKTWFFIFLIILIALSMFLAIKIRIRKLRNQFASSQKLNKLELEVLQMQIRPHFIGNNLELIKSFILEDNKLKSVEAINSFGKMLRDVTQNINQPYITLKEEIEIIENFIIFHRIRFKDSFDYNIIASDINSLNSMEVPPLILQPFVENSIIHGFKSLDYKGLLTIDITCSNNYFLIKIIDNGQGRKTNLQQFNNEHKSIGVNNAIERLKIFNQNPEIPVKIIDLEQGTKIEIKIYIK